MKERSLFNATLWQFLYFKKRRLENTQSINSWGKEAFSKHCLDLNLDDQETGHFYLCIPGISENSIFEIKIIFPCIFNYHLWTICTFRAWTFLFFLFFFMMKETPKRISEFYNLPLRRLKVAILKFSLLYLVNNVHAATSGIQLPLPLKTAASSNVSK